MIIKHEIFSNLKSFLIWTCCVAGLDFAMILFYPSLQESMADMSASYEKLGAFGTAFGMDQLSMAEAIGYYGTYVGVMLALCGAMYAAILGCSILAKEEGGHTVEYLFTLPYSRIHVVLQKITAVAILIAAFELVNLGIGILGLEFIDAEYSLKTLLIFHMGQTFLHLEIAGIAVMISAFTKKVNLGLGLGIALLLYFMDMMSRVLSQLKFCKYITPYYYANAAEILPSGTIDKGLLGFGIVITILCVSVGCYVYNSRDLAA